MKVRPGVVSVVIPAHNAAAYVAAAVESCLRQRPVPLEIIAVDDGSTDGTREVLRRFAEAGDIRYVYQENAERCRTRNRGLDLATGEFVQLLDADDLLAEGKLARQVAFLQAHPDVFAVTCRTHYFRDDPGQVVKVSRRLPRADVASQLLGGNFIPILAPLARRAELRFDPELASHEDWDYWLRLALEGRRFEGLDEPLCFVRVHAANTTRQHLRMEEGRLQVLLKQVGHPRLGARAAFRAFKIACRLGRAEELGRLRRRLASHPGYLALALGYQLRNRLWPDRRSPHALWS